MNLPLISAPVASDARVRASWCATLLWAVEGLPADEHARVPAELDAALREAVHEAGEIGWIPVGPFAAYLDALVEVVGDEQLFQLARAALLDSPRSPLLRRTCELAVRMFGPAGVVHGLVPAWQLVTRGCAEIRAAEGRGPHGTDQILVEFAHAPEPLAHSWAWAGLCRAWLQASLDAVDSGGLVEQRAIQQVGTLRFSVYPRGKGERVESLSWVEWDSMLA